MITLYGIQKQLWKFSYSKEGLKCSPNGWAMMDLTQHTIQYGFPAALTQRNFYWREEAMTLVAQWLSLYASVIEALLHRI